MSLLEKPVIFQNRTSCVQKGVDIAGLCFSNEVQGPASLESPGVVLTLADS